MIDRAVHDIFEAILPLARRTGGEVHGDEAVDQIVELQCRHAGEFLLVQHLEDGRQHLARYVHERQYVRGLYRSEEHTSELQSLMRIAYPVFCWKKKNCIELNKTCLNRQLVNTDR